MPNPNVGSFIPQSNVWDVTEIYSTEVTSPEFKELLVRLYQNLNNMAVSVNGRDAGYYDVNEFVNGQRYFSNPAYDSSTTTNPALRQVYRMVINFGALPNAAAKTIAHNITITTSITFTRIYATASDPVNSEYVPIPYASSVAADNIELSVDATDVTITTGIDRTTFTVCYVVLEYIKT